MKKQSAVKEAIRSLLAERPHTRQQLIRKTGASPGQVTKKLNELRDDEAIIQFRSDGQDWFQLPVPGVTKFEVRKRQNKGLKEEISKYALHLILGDTEISRAGLAFQGRGEEERRSILQSVYASRDRTIILDGGSTNYYVAERLKKVHLPSEVHNLWRLLVVTNSPPIAECLYEATRGPDVTLIGGRVSHETRCTSGHLAEVAIKGWGLEADFTLIGAGGLDLSRGFCNYSEEEAAVKGMLLSRGRIKCVMIDSSKLAELGSGRATMTSCFAPASKAAVDVVISDSNIHHYPELCQELGHRGITIIAASPAGN